MYNIMCHFLSINWVRTQSPTFVPQALPTVIYLFIWNLLNVFFFNYLKVERVRFQMIITIYNLMGPYNNFFNRNTCMMIVKEFNVL